METTRLPASPCPTCNTPMDAASGDRGQVPDPGDISIRSDPEMVRIRAEVVGRSTSPKADNPATEETT